MYSACRQTWSEKGNDCPHRINDGANEENSAIRALHYSSFARGTLSTLFDKLPQRPLLRVLLRRNIVSGGNKPDQLSAGVLTAVPATDLTDVLLVVFWSVPFRPVSFFPGSLISERSNFPPTQNLQPLPAETEPPPLIHSFP